MSRPLRAGLNLLLALWPAWTAYACPVCFNAKQETMAAFRMTTVLLSALPLLMIGGIIFWVARQVRAAARREHDLAQAGRPSPADRPAVALADPPSAATPGTA